MKVEYTGAGRYVYIWVYTDEGETICTRRMDLPWEITKRMSGEPGWEMDAAWALACSLMAEETATALDAATEVARKRTAEEMFDARIRPAWAEVVEEAKARAEAVIGDGGQIEPRVRVYIEVDFVLMGESEPLGYFVVSSEDGE